MEEKDELVGREFRGFNFKGRSDVAFRSSRMDSFVGKRLVIKSVDRLNEIVSTEVGGFTSIYPLQQVLEHLLPKWVWVRDKDPDDWERRALFTDLGEGVVSRYVCVEDGYEDSYANGEKCIYESWSQMSLVNPSVQEEIKELEERIETLKKKL